jgi:hypothetical protein
MTYHSPDPRYDYSKLTAFIKGVNSVGPKYSSMPRRLEFLKMNIPKLKESK